MAQTTLRLNGVGRRFSDAWVFRNCHLTVSPGERWAVSGENGRGKTTLLRIIATLLAPSEGEVWLGETPVNKRPDQLRRILGWAAATEGGFFPHLTGRENLCCFASLSGISSNVVREFAASKKVPTLQTALNTRYQHASAGMRQALHIARALIGSPKIVVLDEPTRSLDSSTTAEIHEWLRSLPGETALIFSTHQKDDISNLATHVFRFGGAAA